MPVGEIATIEGQSSPDLRGPRELSELHIYIYIYYLYIYIYMYLYIYIFKIESGTEFPERACLKRGTGLLGLPCIAEASKHYCGMADTRAPWQHVSCLPHKARSKYSGMEQTDLRITFFYRFLVSCEASKKGASAVCRLLVPAEGGLDWSISRSICVSPISS